MRIETGTTNERMARCGIISLALAGFAVWFAVDGWYRYPRKSMEIFQKDLKLDFLPTPHPKLGYADPVVPRRKYQGGLPKAEILAELGEPNLVRPSPDGRVEEWHYIGQYGRLHLDVEPGSDRTRGKVLAANWEQTPADYRQDSIAQQKIFFVVCTVFAMVGGAAFLMIYKTRVVVDETGLVYNRRVIPWEAMTDLDSAQYHPKGWVKLVYQDRQKPRRLKLDSFKIDAFEEVVDALCRRKGFANPIPINEPLEGDREVAPAEPSQDDDRAGEA